jgi:hypothetical protein
VLYGLLGVGMLRDGEMAGLQWRRVGLDVKPLGRIVVACSYDHEWPKTQAESWMPIHTTLHAMLAEWKLGGWAQMMGLLRQNQLQDDEGEVRGVLRRRSELLP